jgi:predicted ATPase
MGHALHVGAYGAGTGDGMRVDAEVQRSRLALCRRGRPGAGKTAILELARRDLCAHVEVLPESERIIFSGGFPPRADIAARRAAQRAIYHVQNELERLGEESASVGTVLCDRGTLDGLAYWPGSWDEYTRELGTTVAAELARYSAVVHLRVPDGAHGYTKDARRIESAREAQEIDARLVEVWAAHPRRVFVGSTPDFVRKAQRALAVIRAELTCCASKGPRAA